MGAGEATTPGSGSGQGTSQPPSVLNRDECLCFLERASVGRVGVSIGALPVILPVHFARFGEAVRFRTVPGTKLDSATVGAVVAFQVDQWEPSKETYWSVLLQGIASEVTEEQQPASLRSLDIKPWGNSSRLVQVDATNISGRRFKIAGEGPQVELPQPPPVAEPPSL